MANEVINTVIDKKAFEQLDKLVIGLQKANGQFLELAESSAKVGKKSFNVKGVKQYNAQISQSSKFVTDANAANKEAERINNGLARQKAKLNAALSEENKKLIATRYANQQANKAIKEAAVLSSRHATAMQKLTVRRNQAKRAVQEYTAKQALGVKMTQKEEREIKQLRAEYRRLDNGYKKSNRVVGQYFDNVGNYQSGMKKFTGLVRGLVGAFGLVEGARIGLNFAKESLELARQAKSVEFAFNRLGERGVNAFDGIKKSTRGLLSDLDIKKSINEFENFNISLEESDTLFEFLAVRAAQTGQSVDKLKDSLVEGLSKESKLRIDNLGISASELNKELEQTPDFVQAVANIAKREVKEAGNILNETASESEKWNASLENLKTNFGKLIDSKSFGVLGLAAALLGDFADGLITFNEGLKTIGVGIEIFTSQFKSLNGVFKNFKLPSTPKVFGEAFRAAGAYIGGFSNAIKQVKFETREFFKELSKIDISNPISLFNSIKNISFKTKGKNIAEAFNEGIIEVLLKTKQQIEENNDDIENDIEDTSEKVDKSVKGSIDSYKELIGTLEDVRDSTAINSNEYRKQTQRINDLKDAINALKGELKDGIGQDSLEIGFETPDFSDGFDEFDRRAEESQRRQDEARQKAINEQLKVERAITESFNRIGQVYGVDLTNFSELFLKKEITAKEYAEGTADILSLANNALVQNTIDGVNAEINALDRKYSFILENDRLTSDERERIQKEADIKRRQLERKRLKAEKQQAIFSSLINTAAAVVKALPIIPLSIKVGALGAIQTGLIAARKIPEFKHGKDRHNTYEGAAIVGDGGRHEVHYSKRNGISVTPNTPTLTHVDSDDIIFPSLRDFYKSDVFSPDISKHITTGQNQSYNVDSIAKDIIDANRKSIGNAKFINNTVVKSQDINHSLWKNKHINV